MANGLANATQPRDKTPMELANDRLSERVGTLNNLLEGLEQRIRSTLRPVPPAPAAASGPTALKSACSEIVEMCDSQAFGVGQAIDRLQSMLERLEL